MSLAWQFELMESYLFPPKPAARGVLPVPGPRPHQPQAPAIKAAPAVTSVEGRPVRRLNQAEEDERRRLGLCFNCDEKYSRDHNKGKRLFLLDCEEDDDDSEDAAAAGEESGDTESPVFSLHAVAGVPVADMIQITMSVGAASLLALLDSGSTHSFISEDAARCTGLPIEDRPRMTATVANGEWVACPGVIRHAPFSIDATSFATDLFVMPLAGYDLVLGTRWLGTLGPIVWDFATRSISFQQQGCTVCWSGAPSQATLRLRTVVAASGTLLDELLAAYGDIFAEPTGLPP